MPPVCGAMQRRVAARAATVDELQGRRAVGGPQRIYVREELVHLVRVRGRVRVRATATARVRVRVRDRVRVRVGVRVRVRVPWSNGFCESGARGGVQRRPPG